MNRRSIIKGGTAVAATAAVPTLLETPHLAHAQSNVRTAAIGLDRDTWEREHGEGDAGQNVVTYEDGTYSIQFAGNIVVFVELGWESQGGITTDSAAAVVAQLIPSDAELREGYYAPPTSGGPIGLRFERYQSDALANLMKAAARDRSGGILVVSQETPAADRFEPNVSRISITVGIRANSILDQPSGSTSAPV